MHRDLKPSNIRVTPTGRAVILDFGLVTETRSGAESTQATALGTAEYMAPEQARAKEVDWRADQFSVGVVMYEMLNGKPPFGGSLDALIARVTKPPPPLPSTVSVTVIVYSTSDKAP